MFNPKTDRIKKIVKINSSSVKQLEYLLKGNASIYIDYANVRCIVAKFIPIFPH